MSSMITHLFLRDCLLRIEDFIYCACNNCWIHSYDGSYSTLHIYHRAVLELTHHNLIYDNIIIITHKKDKEYQNYGCCIQLKSDLLGVSSIRFSYCFSIIKNSSKKNLPSIIKYFFFPSFKQTISQIILPIYTKTNHNILIL